MRAVAFDYPSLKNIKIHSYIKLYLIYILTNIVNVFIRLAQLLKIKLFGLHFTKMGFFSNSEIKIPLVGILIFSNDVSKIHLGQ